MPITNPRAVIQSPPVRTAPRSSLTIKPKNSLDSGEATSEGAIGDWGAPFGTLVRITTIPGAHGDSVVEGTGSASGLYVYSPIATPGVALVPGEIWTVRCRVRAATVAQDVILYLRHYDAIGSTLTPDPFTITQDVVGSWTTISSSGPVPVGAIQRSIIMYIPSAGAGDKHYFDEFSAHPGVSTEFAMPGRPTTLSR